ncbi:unnamed protein product [Protopolystoma xenopodis]|uniref:Uncharacterized protein n=1 Tax=Protopolystoma xenopodis TaxID=117903 RepID=A0A448WS21_9PLAT|nr:unnamed protein product [Protopolystoma xenopodis]
MPHFGKLKKQDKEPHYLLERTVGSCKDELLEVTIDSGHRQSQLPNPDDLTTCPWVLVPLARYTAVHLISALLLFPMATGLFMIEIVEFYLKEIRYRETGFGIWAGVPLVCSAFLAAVLYWQPRRRHLALVSMAADLLGQLVGTTVLIVWISDLLNASAKAPAPVDPADVCLLAATILGIVTSLGHMSYSINYSCRCARNGKSVNEEMRLSG